MKAPCQNCDKRVIGCHADCKEYNDYVESREKRRSSKKLDSDILAYLRDKKRQISR